MNYPLPATGTPRTQGARSSIGSAIRRPSSAIALAFLALLAGAVLAAPLLAPFDPLAQDLHHVLAGPSGTHLLGTDNLGRDVLSRLLYGGRISLLGVIEALATMLVLGVPLGLIAGYRGGWFDALTVRFTDIMLAIPAIIILLVVLSIFAQNEAAAMISLGVLGAPGIMRVVRGASLAVRPELYVVAARVSGLSHTQIIRRHILPRVTGPIIVQATVFAGVALTTETGLGFLGLGVQDPQPSWGGMVAQASTVMTQDPWLLVPSGMLIGLTVLALGVVGDTVRDATVDRKSPSRAGFQRPRTHRPRASDEVPSAAADSLLAIRGLSVVFPSDSGTVTVVEDVSLEIARGETVGLVGESGSGKSITAAAILGLLPGNGVIQSGSCRFRGQELVGLAPRDYRRIRGGQIAFISQDPVASLDPNHTVESQLAEIVRCHRGGSKRAARSTVLDLLHQVRLADSSAVARRYPHELSGGMAQRVAIAAALAGQPQLLIADEPTTALDVTVQADILDLFRDIQRSTRMSILLVTHDWGVVADLCERAVVMYAGQVVETADVGAMLGRPLHPYTSALLEANPHLAPVGGDLPTVPGSVPAPGAWPSGCRFHPRCPLAGAECVTGSIGIEHPAPGRLTRCVHHNQVPTGARA